MKKKNEKINKKDIETPKKYFSLVVVLGGKQPLKKTKLLIT